MQIITRMSHFLTEKPYQMLSRFVRLIGLPIIAILLIFNLRRIAFSVAILFAGRKRKELQPAVPKTQTLRDVLVLVSCRDEETMVHELCQSLHRLDYPPHHLQ